MLIPSRVTKADTHVVCTEHRISQGQGNLYVRDYAGELPPFVLMHGLPDNSHIYDELIPYLVAAGRRVITFDFLGYGDSDRPPGAEYSFEQQCHDLLSVVDGLRIDRIVPVVHDSSGPAGINFALDNPNRVASLVVLNSPYGATSSLRWPEFVELFANGALHELALAVAQSPVQFGWMLNWQADQFAAHLPESQRKHFAEVIGALIEENFVGNHGAGPAFVQMAARLNEAIAKNTERYPELERLECAVKILWGDYDPYLNKGMARALQSHLKNATLCIIAAGHWLQSDAPEHLAKLMLVDDGAASRNPRAGQPAGLTAP